MRAYYYIRSDTPENVFNGRKVFLFVYFETHESCINDRSNRRKFRTQVIDRLRKGVVIAVPQFITILLRIADIKRVFLLCRMLVRCVGYWESELCLCGRWESARGYFPMQSFVKLLVSGPSSTIRDEMPPHLGP